MQNLKSTAKKVLSSHWDKVYERKLDQRTGEYPEWLSRTRADRERAERLKELEETKDHTGAHRNGTASLPELVYWSAGAECGEKSENLEEICLKFFRDHPEVQIAYGDEDDMDPARRKAHDPWFKPDWSPDLYASAFYFGSLIVMRESFLAAIDGGKYAEALPSLESAEGIALADLCVEKAGGYCAGCRAVGHIPEILFHRTGAHKFADLSRQQERKEKYLKKILSDFQEKEQTNEETTVSVIIPSKDHPALLAKCIESIKKTTRNLHLEIIVVDNGSSESNRKEVEKLLESSCRGDFSTRYIYEDAEFNFSHMCNLGAEAAEGRLLLFLNDDVELCVQGTIERLAALTDREMTGAAGIKLYYPDSRKIQHAGITNLPMGPVHKLQFKEDNRDYYHGMNTGIRNCIAVTAACLMVERKKYQTVGGFCEDLRVAFNDVDLCLSLHEKGYYNLCDNDLFAWHHESLTRGNDESAEKTERLLRERDKLYERHPLLEGKDPFYPAGLAKDMLDTSVRPQYETCRNTVQVCSDFQVVSLEGYREDPCLLLRVEWSGKGRIQGYAVVLGDDNACYEKWLLFRSAAVNEKVPIYGMKLTGQYRPELMENMPAQVNVGLCGFSVEIRDTALCGQEFWIGVMAKSRVSNTKLCSWSSRKFTVPGKETDPFRSGVCNA